MSIEQQLEGLKLQYNQYASNAVFDGSSRVDAQIEEDLKAIYDNGSTVMGILKKIKPESLFGATELSSGKRDALQLHYDANSRQFKTLWVILYDLKQEHKSQKVAFAKVYVQANYPNAKEAEITPLAEYMVQTNCASFDKYVTATEMLQYVTLRHKEILKLEASINEVHQLFVDMEALVQQQGYTIDRIRENIQSAKELVKSARDDLGEAYQCKKKHWYSL